MQVDDPPYLSVGTAVSAKYKGAFCEAKVSKVVRLVKCKVTYKMGLGTATVSDEFIKGPLRVGQTVQAKHPEKKDFVEATITKIQDCSQYTVVFDDGDITTLRRTALCLKSGRHFNESETLDQLPLTHPEHFGNPVVGGRRGRRSRQMKEDSSEGEVEEENEPDLELYSGDIGRVVCIETSDKKRSKDNWFPGLVVIPSAQPTVRINAKDEFLVRSFKDGRYYTVPKKEVTEFNREMGNKAESSVLAEAVEKVIKYLDNDELPAHWERSLLFNTSSPTSESDENFSDSSIEETTEEKDHFVAQLIKFMDDSNTPLNKSPTICNKDVDLHRLFRIVEKLGGYNRVTNKSKWRSVSMRMKLPNIQTTYNQVKQVYKKCLLNYESFYRTLGVTMLNHSRAATKKSKGRSLIRDKDRTTPVNSPRPDKEEESFVEKVKEEEKVKDEEKSKPSKQKFDFPPKVKEEEKRKKEAEVSDTNSSDATDQSEAASSTNVVRSRRLKIKHKLKTSYSDSQLKITVEKLEETSGSAGSKKLEKDDDKSPIQPQQTRSKMQQTNKKEMILEKKVRETKTPIRESVMKAAIKPVKKPNEEERRRGRKKIITDEKTIDSNATESSNVQNVVSIGDKLKVYYGPTHESKVTYEAKVIEIDKDKVGPVYLVHYTGWNTRYDEWIHPNRIADNLSAATKAKKLKQHSNITSNNSGKNTTTTTKLPSKRGRGMSITGRSTVSENPRAVTPSISSPGSAKTKSPVTPVNTRTYRSKRQAELNRRTRLSSSQSEILNNSESESESENEFEIATTSKSEPTSELKTYRRKLVRTPSVAKMEKRKDKDDGDTEKEEEDKSRRLKKVKKNLDEKSTESDEDSGSNPPKGRDFDLNQIRSELKGFVKSVKAHTSEDAIDKDSMSSDDSSSRGVIDVTSIAPVSIVDNAVTESTSKQSKEEIEEKKTESEDVYEFKEPEPFEFESRPKMQDDKGKKRLVPRVLEETPKKRTIEERKQAKISPIREEESKEDPFDKLIESPSFHSGREKLPDIENKQAVSRVLNLLEEEPSSELFTELDDDTLDISDNEPLFTHNDKLFADDELKRVEDDDDFGNDSEDEDVLAIVTSNEEKEEQSDDKVAEVYVTELVKDMEIEKNTTVEIQKTEVENDVKTLEVDVDKEKKEEEEEDKLIIKEEKEQEKKAIEEVEVKVKKTKKAISKEFIEESDSDSSDDSEKKLIIRSEVNSPIIPEEKPIIEIEQKIEKIILPVTSFTSDRVGKQEEEEVKKQQFEEEVKDEVSEKVPKEEECDEIEEETKLKIEEEEEEADSQLHSMLLCEETIPGSPTPPNDESENEVKSKQHQLQQQQQQIILEMPFASAPGSSNNNNSNKTLHDGSSNKRNDVIVKDRLPNTSSTVLDNTPPTTPESTLSNLSPRRDNEDLSPNTADNTEAEADYLNNQRRGSNNKINNTVSYIEEDTLLTNPEGSSMTTCNKAAAPSLCKKRRKSCKGADETIIPAKRGRKPANRSRHNTNSDSDDMSENSMGSNNVTTTLVGNNSNLDVRPNRSPRPSKFNFYVELDPSWDSSQRIAVLQQKLQELRKTYAGVKSELATIERRRKKIRRREREAKMAAKQQDSIVT